MKNPRLAIAIAVVALVSAGCGGPANPTLTVAPSATPTATSTPPPAAPTATPAPTTAAGPTRAPTWTPGPEATIGVPADDGARIIAVEYVPSLRHEAWVRVGDPRCPVHDEFSDVGCWVSVGTPEPTSRIVDLTIESPAGLQTTCVGPISNLRTSKVRLILPKHFAEQPATRWPVLYLHHGGCTDYTFWSQDHDVLTLAAPTDLLIVMPEGDEIGYPRWDTFHLVELRQLLERNWQAGDKRAIAGMSMGGTESMEESERAQGTFLFAGSYSGGLDQPRVIDNAAALRGMALYVSYGNGKLGPLDNGQPAAFDPAGEIEAYVSTANAAFVKRLAELGIPVTVHAYGNGTHDPKYWQRELERSFPLILAALGL